MVFSALKHGASRDELKNGRGWKRGKGPHPHTFSFTKKLTNALSTAGNSMTSSERPSPEPILKKEASPAVPGGRENSGNALDASNALNYRVWGIPAVLSTEIPGNALRAVPVSFRNFSGISSGKSQPYWGCGPETARFTSKGRFVLAKDPQRFTTRPLPVNFTTTLPFVRPFWILRKDEI